MSRRLRFHTLDVFTERRFGGESVPVSEGFFQID
jgi:hypothetical protein